MKKSAAKKSAVKSSAHPVFTLSVVNPAAHIKEECYKCGYLNKAVKVHYKCHTEGSCPALPAPRTVLQRLQDRLPPDLNSRLDELLKAAEHKGLADDQGTAHEASRAAKVFAEAHEEFLTALIERYL